MQNEMRNRLVNLINQDNCPSPFMCSNECKYAHLKNCCGDRLADHLIENGVIVPPCKVGDKMYKLCTVNSRIKMGQMWDGITVKNNCDRCGYRNCSCYDIGLRKHECETMIDVIEEKTITSLEFLIRIMPYVGTVWFNTKEEAEQKLQKRGD